jgi:hypothetical protein
MDMPRVLLPVVGLLAALGCRTAARTEMVVDVDSNLAAPAELDQVKLTVRLTDGHVQQLPAFSLRAGGYSLPLRVGLLALETRADDEITVTATALDPAGQELATQMATASFVAGRSLLLRMYLARECLAGGPCQEAGTTCSRGPICIEVRRPPLPSVSPRRSEVEADAASPDSAVELPGPDAGTPDLARVGDSGGPDSPTTALPDAALPSDQAAPDARPVAEAAPADRAPSAERPPADLGGPPPGRKAALVVGDPAVPSPSDTVVRARLEKLGFSVTVVDDDAASPGDAVGRQLLVLAPSISFNATALDRIPAYEAATIPILCLAVHTCESLGMTVRPGTQSGQSMNAEDTITIDVDTHPLAAGFTAGNVPVVAGRSGADWVLYWMNPHSTATRVASIRNHPSQVTIFGFDQGTRLSTDLLAPARRVGFTLVSNTYNGNYELNASGLALLDAAIAWASQ